ncbi:hypothetical protein MPSEU_000140900 [Mayamaea pseudoterrestris]|nr:hypothetical protein MPSEU_000140900 [Mayamaea pseudoterrestris]
MVAAPIAPSASLPGQLFLYAAGRAAFESPLLPEIASSATHQVQQQIRTSKCILLGGLSDGLWPVPYTHQLYHHAILPSPHWSLVQPVLSSSYTGFGHGSLQRDTEELDELVSHLMQHGSATEFGIVGHSTGCQNAVHYMKHGKYRDKLKVVALQAPVSDREQAQLQDERYESNIDLARSMRDNNKGDEMMPRQTFWAPITANRFLDLQEYGGADDFFSSDYTDEQLEERLSHVGSRRDRKVLVAFSGADEYVSSAIKDSQLLLNRLVNAMNAACPADEPVAKGLYLQNGNHNLSQAPGDGEMFVQAFAELLQAPDTLA